MSEHFPGREKHEHAPSHEHAEMQPKHHERHEREHKAEASKPNVEAIHHKIEKEAKSGKEIRLDKAAEKSSADHFLVTKELKQEALKRNLQRARKHMSTTSRSFSKFIHKPSIDAISKVGEKTIARPTGILTGAIIALAGSSYLFWSAKHYGYQYNYFVVILLFVGGYLAGLIIETLIYIVRRMGGAK